MDKPGSGPESESGITAAPRLSRRRLIRLGVPVLGGAVAGGLLLRRVRPHPSPAGLAAGAYPARRLTLAVYDAWLDPALLAARDQGIFARYNLEVTFAEGIGSGGAAVEAVQSGHADAALAPVLSWLPRLQRGLDGVLVCGLRSGAARLLIPRQAPMHRIEDLFRHAIGIADPDPEGPDRLFFSIMMRRKGMHPNHDVTWQVIPEAALGLALAEGKVQAIIGHDPAIWRVGRSLHLTELAGSRTGSYAARVNRALGLRGTLLHAEPQAARALTLAIRESADWAAKHPREIGVLLASRDPDLTLPEATSMLHDEGSEACATGHILRDQIAEYADELKLLGITPEAVDSAQFARKVTANPLKPA